MRTFLLALALLFVSTAAQAQANKWVTDLQNGLSGPNPICEEVRSGGACFFPFGDGTPSTVAATTNPLRLNAAEGELCINVNTTSTATTGGAILFFLKAVDAATINGSTLISEGSLPFTDNDAFVNPCVQLTRGTYIVAFTIPALTTAALKFQAY